MNVDNDLMFSVAIITYNQKDYIKETLDSIILQEHTYKYEIVIGDDCSFDGTQDIIKSYMEKYPNIIKPIFNEKNKGIIGNYFNVIDHCIGKYILECAGDDYWLPGKVEKQISFMENNPDISFIYGYAKCWSQYTGKFKKKLFGSNKKTLEDFLKGNDVPAPTICYKNSIIKQYMADVKPLEKNWKMEDYPEYLWLAKNSKIQFIEDTFAVYREIENSACHIQNFEKQFAFNKSYYDIQEYFANEYKVPYNPKQDVEIWFEVYYASLLKKYDKSIYNKMNEYYCMMENPSRHYKIIMLFSRFKLFFLIFRVIK